MRYTITIEKAGWSQDDFVIKIADIDDDVMNVIKTDILYTLQGAMDRKVVPPKKVKQA